MSGLPWLHWEADRGVLGDLDVAAPERYVRTLSTA
jgi:hypothetical protein